MRNLFHILFAIPRFFIHLVWNVFWRLVRTAIVFALVVLGLAFYANHSQSALAQSISSTLQTVSQYFQSQSASNVTKKLSSLTTDDLKVYSCTRWTTNSASIYIKTQDATLVSAYQEAITAWNATGAFTLTLTTDESSADIIATDYSDASTQAAGLAETESNAVTNHLTHVDVKLNTYYLLDDSYGYTYERIVNTAEHELGHAMGLSHDDSEDSVMQSSGSYFGIQDADIQALKKLYQS